MQVHLVNRWKKVL